jgi:hypothetical protein
MLKVAKITITRVGQQGDCQAVATAGLDQSYLGRTAMTYLTVKPFSINLLLTYATYGVFGYIIMTFVRGFVE